MGLILDSSVAITAERQKLPVEGMLAAIHAIVGSTEIALSVVSVMELEHGIWRAKDAGRQPAAAVPGGLDRQGARLPHHYGVGPQDRPDRRGTARKRHLHRLPRFADRGLCAGTRLCGWNSESAPLSDDPRSECSAPLKWPPSRHQSPHHNPRFLERRQPHAAREDVVVGPLDAVQQARVDRDQCP